MNKSINILGAGPAGLTAGINLAKAGFKVTIFEKNGSCGMRFSGDLQGLENWTQETDILQDLEKMNIAINFHCEPFFKVINYDFENKTSEVKSEKPFGYLVRRGPVAGTLDQGLMKQALKHKVKLKFNSNVDKSKCKIIATGPSAADGLARGITFKTKMRDTVAMFFDNDIAPGAYAYLLISKGFGCLTTAISRHFHKEEEYFQKLREKVNDVVDLRISNVKDFSNYANFFLTRKYEFDDRLHVGECIGLQDFFLGFGMRYAITSGYFAAKSIIDDEDYDAMVRKRFNRELNISLVNRFLFEKIGNRGYRILINFAARSKNPLRFIHNLYTYPIIRKPILPIAKISMGSKKNRHKDCYCSWCRSIEQEYN